jgi:hypothetical protein
VIGVNSNCDAVALLWTVVALLWTALLVMLMLLSVARRWLVSWLVSCPVQAPKHHR